MKQMTTTCDACGTARDVEVVPETVDGHGWFTISRVGWYIGESRANEQRPPRPPDLCSWECVAAYAQKRAEGSPAVSRTPVQ
jgi:hypothetical protein